MRQRNISICLWCVCVCVTMCTRDVSAQVTRPGDIDWIRTFNSVGPAPTSALAIAADREGNIYTAGSVGGVFAGERGGQPIDAFVRKYSSTGDEVWTRQFGTDGLQGDQAHAVAVDASGIYVAGFAAAALPGQSFAGGSTDAFVRKYDLDGNELWTREFGTAANDQVYGLFADANGVYAAGFVSTGGGDAFVRRFDNDGNEIWARQFGTTGGDRALAVAADASAVYVVGLVGNPPPTVTGLPDAFVRKFDLDGNLVWFQVFGGLTGPDVALAVALDATGVYVAGSVGLVLPGQPASEPQNAFVRKYTAAGSILWTRQFTTTGDDQALGIAVNTSGIYVTGLVATSLSGQTSAGQSDAFLRRYDFNGAESWTRQFGSSGIDRGSAIVATPFGVFVAGTVTGTLPDEAATGLPDGFVRGYDATTGIEIWTRQFGTTWLESQVVRAVAVHDGVVYGAGTYGVPLLSVPTATGGFLRAHTSDGTVLWEQRITTGQTAVFSAQGASGVAAGESGIYVTGVIGGALPGQTSAGNTDIFVRKYDVSGAVVWTRQFGTTGSDIGRAVALDSTGVYVIGTAGSGALPGQVNAGLSDAFIRKYSVDGDELWTRQFGSTGSDQGVGVAVSDGGVFVIGTTGAALPGQLHLGAADAFISAFNGDGTPLWTAQFGTTASDQASGVAADSSGVYVTGSINGLALPIPPDQREAFVRKFSHAGGLLWERVFSDEQFPLTPSAITVSPRGVYVTVPLRLGTIESVATGMLRKYDTNGLEIWSRELWSTDGMLSLLSATAEGPGLYVGGQETGVEIPPAFRNAFLARIVDFTPVSIDIKPGAAINSVNLGSNGSVPVAILSSETFDAATVNPGTITLANAGVRLRGNGTAMAALEDVNGDGRADLVVHVKTQALTLAAGDTEATLSGETFAGDPIRGTDRIRVVR